MRRKPDIITAVQRLTAAEVAVYERYAKPSGLFRFGDMMLGDLLKIITAPENVVQVSARIAEDASGDVMVFFDVKKTIENGMQWLSGLLQRWDVPLSHEERLATDGVEFPTFCESMITDVVGWYHLTSAADAERLTVGEWYLFAKNRAAQNKFKANYTAIMAKK